MEDSAEQPCIGPAAGGDRIIAIGMRRWKQAQLRPMLQALCPRGLRFVANAGEAARQRPSPSDMLLWWGPSPGEALSQLAQRTRARLVRVEDGFLRSVGLGSDLVSPRSLVFDERGLYNDARTPSALEHLLQNGRFNADELEQAARLRAFLVEHGLTKYNHEPRQPVRWPSVRGRRVVLVPGQVEDDASILLSCANVRTNAGLLEAVRNACPDACIVYKPHPDVSSGNRIGALSLQQARRWADHVEPGLSMVSCIEACDEVHTMTSLGGFDALLRGKSVTTYGQPFYAGWGLTTDQLHGPALERRQRRLTLDELVAGTLIRHPVYWDPVLKGFTTAMAAARQLLAERDALVASGTLSTLHIGWHRRQWRKARTLWQAYRPQ